jgi:hypothetical protein
MITTYVYCVISVTSSRLLRLAQQAHECLLINLSCSVVAQDEPTPEVSPEILRYEQEIEDVSKSVITISFGVVVSIRVISFFFF